MDISIAADLKYFNYLGSLEQGLEHGFIFLLNEYFSVSEECWDPQRLFHKLKTHSAFLLCAFSDEFSGQPTGQKTCHMKSKQMVFYPLCVLI